jgi:outer membrane lipoprotein
VTGLTFTLGGRDNIIMKKILLMTVVAFVLAACSPVLTREVMKQGIRDVSLNQISQSPEGYKGKLFILGGMIVETRFVEKGSQIEALSVPVDSFGYLKEKGPVQGRFLAFYPKAKGLLDPAVYKKGREVTLAGEFVEMRQGKIDEMEYLYPVFEIKQIYLWEEHRDYYGPYNYYYPYYYSPYYYDPFYGPWGMPYGYFGYPYWPPPR